MEKEENGLHKSDEVDDKDDAEVVSPRQEKEQVREDWTWSAAAAAAAALAS